ncbi:unnamed protein product (mitochondrion) [Plasmodiophora brassicae]|uniref:SGS domain-containing protein n=1 Tax=Plasmodiophora brassicae TaxID=37360 RepID=A0A0G4J8X5_PLABS|nr:hypothetical protein PBRA_003451 [Plasmodiophora brassicae]SPQ99803.1 unnamed protein product [Plasmodiophora brassicae]
MASFASEGNGLFVDEDWQGALRAYTKAIDADPANADLYGRRAATLLKLGRAADALVDAEKGLELAPDNALLNLRAGICAFQLDSFRSSKQFLTKAQALGAKDADVWLRKCSAELADDEGAADARPDEKQPSSSPPPPPTDEREERPPEASPITLAQKARDSFYDKPDVATYVILAKDLKPEDVSVDLKEDAAEVKITFADGSKMHKLIHLFATIVPGQSKFELNRYKLQLIMKKATPGSWPRVQHDVNSDSNLIALYPTSSKKKQDWGSIERQVIEEEEKETPDGDAALNKLFQQIYRNASDETKRAMIKSYQTSGGTVLSTNWEEVKDKDYEEKIEAPTGMEVHRWTE